MKSFEKQDNKAIKIGDTEIIKLKNKINKIRNKSKYCNLKQTLKTELKKERNKLKKIDMKFSYYNLQITEKQLIEIENSNYNTRM